MDLDWRKVGIAGVVAGLISFVYSSVTCGYLFNWIYELPPTAIWKPVESYTASWFISSFVISLILFMIIAAVYGVLYKGLPGDGVKKGLWFGIIIWLVGIVPGMASTYMTMTVNTTVIMYLLAMGIVKYLIIGVAIAYIFERVR